MLMKWELPVLMLIALFIMDIPVSARKYFFFSSIFVFIGILDVFYQFWVLIDDLIFQLVMLEWGFFFLCFVILKNFLVFALSFLELKYK